jgi:hypothetical protein
VRAVLRVLLLSAGFLLGHLLVGPIASWAMPKWFSGEVSIFNSEKLAEFAVMDLSERFVCETPIEIDDLIVVFDKLRELENSVPPHNGKTCFVRRLAARICCQPKLIGPFRFTCIIGFHKWNIGLLKVSAEIEPIR